MSEVCCRNCFHFNGDWQGCEWQPPMSVVEVLRDVAGVEEFCGFVPNPDEHHCSAFAPPPQEPQP